MVPAKTGEEELKFNYMIILLLVTCHCILFLLLSYPVFAWIRSLLFRKSILKSELFIKPVSILIAGYKEDIYLRDKILSFLNNDEWIDGSEIIIVASGATDNTCRILDEFNFPEKITCLIFAGQMSKIESVNMAAGLARNEILVFSDCRQKMKKKSVSNLVQNFNDPEIGTVVATLEDPDHEGKGSFFRRILNFIAFCESRSGSSLNVYGALYAQRKSIFRKFPPDILFDDLFVVVSTLTQHKRLIQDKESVIYDVHFDSYYKGERIQRLARGLLLFLMEQNKLIQKLKYNDLFRFLFFKYVKLIIPLVLLMLTYCCFFLVLRAHSYLSIILFFSFLLPVLLIRKSRNILFLIIRINYHFMLMLFKFIFMHERSTGWEKLEVEK